MVLNKGVYDFTKWVALIFLPAAGTLYIALAQIWDLKYQTQVSGSVLAVDTFLGALVGISSKSYKPQADGNLVISSTGPQSAVARVDINTHPDVVIANGKKYYTLAIVQDQGHTTTSVPVEMPGPARQPKSYD